MTGDRQKERRNNMAIFYNQATLSYSGGVVNSNVTAGEIVAPLTVTKTPTVDEYTAGSDVTYAVNLTNTGSFALNGLSISDDLGRYTLDGVDYVPLDYIDGSVRYFVNGVLQPAPAVGAGDPLVVSGIDIPANGNALLLYTARVNGFAPLEVGSVIVNTVTVDGTCASGLTAVATVSVSDEAELDITKSISPTTLSCSDRVTYTINIINTGNVPAVAADDVVVSDVFDPALSDITVTFNGAVWSEPENYTYDPVTGRFATLAGQITVPAATYTRDPVTGVWTVVPAVVTLVISGTV